MNYNDPARSKLSNWRPCWLDSMIALPALQLYPHTDPSLVTLSICHGSRGIWLSKDIPLTSLIQVLHFWTEDPEGTFMSLFGLDHWPRQIPRPVTEAQETKKSTPLSVYDLV